MSLIDLESGLLLLDLGSRSCPCISSALVSLNDNQLNISPAVTSTVSIHMLTMLRTFIISLKYSFRHGFCVVKKFGQIMTVMNMLWLEMDDAKMDSAAALV